MENRWFFKAKRKDFGEWVFGGLAYCEKNGAYFITKMGKDNISYIGYSQEIDPSTICQCTGWKDKNGKLIWENDVVDFLGHKGTVKYECGGFGIAFKQVIDWEEIESYIMPITGCENALYACENDNYISLWEIYWNFNDEDNYLTTVEVIGNKFDNPKLLEE